MGIHKFNPCFYNEKSGWFVMTRLDATGKEIGLWFDDPLDAIDWAKEHAKDMSEVMTGEVRWVVRTEENENAASGIFLDGQKVTTALNPSTL